MEEIVESVKYGEGCLELVDTGKEYEIRINGEVKAVEYDFNRACETFESFKH